MFKNRLSYLFVLVCALTYLYFTGDRLASLLVYSLLLFPALSLLCLLLSLPFLRVTHSLSGEYVAKGERFVLLAEIRNRGPFYLPSVQPVFYQNEVCYEQAFTCDSFALFPGGKRELMLENRCLYAGEFETGVQSLRLTDFCGLFSMTLKKPPLALYSCPKSAPVQQPVFGMDQRTDAEGSLHQQREDLSEIYGVREYREGDAPKRIHWKLTARTGELLVRQYNRMTESGCFILPDPRRLPVQDFQRILMQDKLLDCAASLAAACLAARMSAKLVINRETLESVEINSEDALALAVRQLAGLKFSPELRLSDVLALFRDRLGKGVSVVLIAFSMDAALCGQMLDLREQGSELLLYLLEEADAEILRRLSDAGIPVRMIG